MASSSTYVVPDDDTTTPDIDIVKQEVEDIEDDLADVNLDHDDDVIVVDVDKVMQCLSGKMSFEELSHILQKGTVKTELSNESDGSSLPQASDSAATPSKSSGRVPGSSKVRHRGRLPKLLEGLMGEANMKYVCGDYDEAVKMCMEVIRMEPSAPDPFQTLAEIYEAFGENEKSLQFRLIAAHLIQSDADEWLRVAELCSEQRNMPQLLVCYEKASRLQPNNQELWLSRYELLKSMNDMKKALECYRHYLEILPPEDGETYMRLARETIQVYNERDEPDKVLEMMLSMFKKHPELVNDTDVNSLLEMYISKSVFDKSLSVLVKHSGVLLYDAAGPVCIESADSVLDFKHITVTRCTLRNQIPIDLQAKLIVCLIRLRFAACVRELLYPILAENPDEVGDLYLDIAEAYMSQGLYSDAKPFLETLVQSAEYNKAGVWLRYAECLNALCELNEAIVAYENVVQKAPCHYEARVSLSVLYQQLGKQDEALNALRLDDTPSEVQDKTLDVRLAILSCRLQYSQERYDQFIECTKRIIFSFSRDMFDVRKQQNSQPHSRMWKSRFDVLRSAVTIPADPHIKPVDASMYKSSTATEDLWDLYLKLCEVLIDRKMFEEFETVSIVALACPLFLLDQNKAIEAEFICLTACIMNHNGHFAYGFIREYCVKNLENNRAWNTFCQIITISQDQRHNKFCLRLAMKHPDNHALGVLNGHNALIAGSYKHALGEYTAALKTTPNDPLLSLLVGVTFFHMASQRFSTKRHLLTMQGCAFLNRYMELRGECQEAYFNIGRAMHQLGLYSSATEYYRKALDLPPAISDENRDTFDLTKDIAYNLNLIYINSGSYELASQICQKYLVI